MYSPRWPITILFALAALTLWLASLVAYPFTSWGIGVEQVRPSVAALSRDCAVAALALMAATAFALFWGRGNPWTRWDRVAAATISVFAATMVMRLGWLAWAVWPR